MYIFIYKYKYFVENGFQYIFEKIGHLVVSRISIFQDVGDVC